MFSAALLLLRTACSLLVGLFAFTALSGCSDPGEVLAEVRELAAAGDYEVQREVLRRGLESHPEDVPLLLQAVEFYLREAPEGRYRPRLALHYAMRAARVAGAPRPEVSRLLFKAYRAAGSSDQELALLREGLQAVHHPDAMAPRQRQRLDPELVELTLANLREQKRRQDRTPDTSPCVPPMVWIPPGRYPFIHQPATSAEVEQHNSTEVSVLISGVCIDRLMPGSLASLLVDRAAVGKNCQAAGKRACSVAEQQVACGAMLGVLGTHPGCLSERALRCCRDPEPGS